MTNELNYCRRKSAASPLLAGLGLIAACFLTVSPLQGQTITGSPSAVSQRFSYMSWGLSGDSTDLTVKQWYLPIIVKADVAEDWSLSFYSAAAGSDADWDVENGDISGLTDTRVQAAHSLADDQVLISGGVSVPTGVTELSPEQHQLIPWLSADFFNFPVKYPGEGLNLFGEVGVALPAGDWVWGAAGAVHYSGEYTPFDDGRKYQPGLRLVGTIGADRDWPDQGHVGVDLLVIHSSSDKAEGEAVFADGVQFDFRLTGQREFDKGRIDAAARFILRGKNKTIGGENLDLVREQSNTNGNDIRFFLSGRRDLSPRAQGWLSVEAKFLAANGYDAGEVLYEDAASVYGFGGGADFKLSSRASAGLGIRLWTGSSDGSYAFEPVDFSGFEIMQRLTVTF